MDSQFGGRARPCAGSKVQCKEQMQGFRLLCACGASCGQHEPSLLTLVRAQLLIDTSTLWQCHTASRHDMRGVRHPDRHGGLGTCKMCTAAYNRKHGLSHTASYSCCGRCRLHIEALPALVASTCPLPTEVSSADALCLITQSVRTHNPPEDACSALGQASARGCVSQQFAGAR